jgi:hypothetical protein
MVSPSQSRTLLATAPMVGSPWSVSTAARTHPVPGRASLLRNPTNSPVAAFTPVLHPPANPVFDPASTTVACGTAARILATLPSSESLSTTISSSWSDGQSTSANDRRATIVSSAPL